MSTSRPNSPVDRTIAALRNDLLGDSGPNISTLRNYPFAILVYSPADEWEMRRAIDSLSGELKNNGWFVDTVNMKSLMLRKLKEFFTEEELEDLIVAEKDYSDYDDPFVGLDYIREAVFDALHGPEGIASVLAEDIAKLAENSDRADRTVVFVGQMGALYPFSRTSALLKFLDGRTEGIPVVFLYPGSQIDGGLSFLDATDPDRDYRPRIYTPDTMVV